PREWQDSDVLWLTGTHDSDGVRYFNQESYEEMMWWIQVPALVAATPSEQRAAAQESSAAVNRARQAAKNAGYRLDVLLAAESRSDRASARPDAAASSRKVSKAAAAKASSKVKEKSTAPRDGAGGATLQKKNPAAKTKKTTKTSNPSKRKP
ncbi:MAG TPA: alpha-amylase, partial [Acidobacteriaceae bacterium]|nr:alpha-amylase [Acidobacteriaceae bacterium]